MLTIGSLCTGYGGLDLAVPGRQAWNAEIDPAAAKVLAAHWPAVPNLGDLTAVDWAAVPPVDMLTAGYPCQPFSAAGRRKGTADDRHLWPHIAAAVRRIRPRYVFLENVAGHRSMGFGDVLGDLAALGYDTRWESLRAADVGAPHRRERVFILATNPGGIRWHGRRDGPVAAGRPPSPTDRLGEGFCYVADPAGKRRDQGRPEPAGKLRRLDAVVGRRSPGGVDWGRYEPAIRRWERVVGRVAPVPTRPGRNGAGRLNPAFVEFLMGLPDGWVTGVPGLTRSEQLHVLGNGVVPQQAAEALRCLT